MRRLRPRHDSDQTAEDSRSGRVTLVGERRVTVTWRSDGPIDSRHAAYLMALTLLGWEECRACGGTGTRIRNVALTSNPRATHDVEIGACPECDFGLTEMGGEDA